MPDFADGAWTVSAEDEAALRHRMPDLPDVRHEVDTPLGRPILTFTAAGQHAVDWSARLRAIHAQTGRWPLLMVPNTPLYWLSDGSSQSTWQSYEDPVDVLREAADTDGAAAFTERAGKYLLDEYAAAIEADRRGELTWPQHPRRHEQLELPFDLARGGRASDPRRGRLAGPGRRALRRLGRVARRRRARRDAAALASTLRRRARRDRRQHRVRGDTAAADPRRRARVRLAIPRLQRRLRTTCTTRTPSSISRPAFSTPRSCWPGGTDIPISRSSNNDGSTMRSLPA